MLVNMEGNLKFLWLVALISCICLANGRQIRISRYTTEISESAEAAADEGNSVGPFEIEATVREIKLAPYPAAGYRPSKAFPLPNEKDNDLSGTESVTEESPVIANEPESLALTTTTEGYASETTTYYGADESEVNIVKAPYAAAGFRPKIAFNLPTEIVSKNQQEDVAETQEFTTKTPLADFTTRATEAEVGATSTPTVFVYLFKEGEQEAVTTETPLAEFTTRAAEVELKAPYPPAGFRPRIPFSLPTANLFKEQELEPTTTDTPFTDLTTLATEKDVKTPYPAAGFRPSKAFLLPNEQLNEEEPKVDNSKHPACGSSTNPLAPKPLDGEKQDPDAETVFVTPTQTVVLPVRLTAAQPLIVSRPFVYTTHFQAW